MTTKRRKDFDKALSALVPSIPLADFEAVRAIADRPHLRSLPAPIACWLALTTHVRHEHSDYDALLDEGYDADSARHFVLDDMNEVLRLWKSLRLLDPDED